MKPPFKKIAIIGVGLIGGSLGMAVREKKLAAVVSGADSDPSAAKRAVSLGAVDEGTADPNGAVAGADLVVLATPVGRLRRVAKEIASSLARDAVVTDAGSVKGGLVGEIESLLSSGARFVGGHPVAGREKSGVAAASADLFNGAVCVLTPTAKTDPEALGAVRSLWEGVGCRVALMDAERHDRILGAVSHLPHVAAFALVDLLSRMKAGDPDLLDYAAGGFRDFTRIAGSSPEMWRDILLANREAVCGLIDRYCEALGSLKKSIEGGDSAGLKKILDRASAAREGLNRTDK
jgi:prephenate dehydrogenase